MSDTSGPTSRRQFALYDRDSSSWRMWPDIGLWGSIEYSQTWPASGMTRSGAAYELPMSGHRTGGNGSLLLPTPTAQQDGSASDLDKRKTRVDAAKAKHGRIFGQTLEVAVAMLPTPRATDGTKGGTKGGPNQRGSSGDLMLPSAVLDL